MSTDGDVAQLDTPWGPPVGSLVEGANGGVGFESEQVEPWTRPTSFGATAALTLFVIGGHYSFGWAEAK